MDKESNQINKTGLELLDSKTLELLRLPKLSRFSGLPNKRKKIRFLSVQPHPLTLPLCLQVFFQDLDSRNFKVQTRPQHDGNKCGRSNHCYKQLPAPSATEKCTVGHRKWLLNVTVWSQKIGKDYERFLENKHVIAEIGKDYERFP